MKLEDFEQPDGWYKYEGCDYETSEDLLQTGILGFCGCGCAEENLKHVRGGLECILALQEKVWTKKLTWDEWNKQALAHFGSEGGKYFFFYWAAEKDFTEHGGAVPGWLSEKGKDVLAMLREELTTS